MGSALKYGVAYVLRPMGVKSTLVSLRLPARNLGSENILERHAGTAMQRNAFEMSA